MKVGLVIAIAIGLVVPAATGVARAASANGEMLVAQSTAGTLTTAPGVTATTSPVAGGAITGAHDAFVLTCIFDVRTSPPPLLVFDASGSAAGPVIAAGTPCSQALGTLLSAGFVLASAMPGFDGATQYTLVR